MFQTMHKKCTEVSGIRLLFNITTSYTTKFDWLRLVVFQLSLKYLHVKITTPLRVVVYKQIIAWFVCDIFWRKYHLWYFKIVSNFTRLTAREITYNSFEISLQITLLPILILMLVKFTYPGQRLQTPSLSLFILSWFPAQYHKFGLPQTAANRWGHGMLKAKSTESHDWLL